MLNTPSGTVLAVAGLVALVYGGWRWIRPDRTAVPLAETAREAWDDPEQGATLSVDVDGDVAVDIDARQLRELFAELFTNAVAYGSGTVSIRVERTADGFAVVDDGPGIPSGDRDEVLEYGHTTHPDRPGTGLAMVHAICETYDWDLAITDRTDEVSGTRVEITNVTFAETWGGSEGVTAETEDVRAV